MRPFFTYYGGKWRAAPRYPAPAHDTIIEPFAGAAGYSLRHHAKRVVLCDLDPVLAGVWRYLIAATPAEVMALPLIEPGQHVDDVNACQEARWLIGFWLTKGGARPNKTLSAWGRDPRHASQFWGAKVRARIASQVTKIDHWQVIEGSFESLPNRRATWFVDPPYQVAGRYYKESAVDYSVLAEWCRRRLGQVIVCENEGADWLPFQPFMVAKANESRTGGKRSREAVWVQRDGQTQFCWPLR